MDDRLPGRRSDGHPLPHHHGSGRQPFNTRVLLSSTWTTTLHCSSPILPATSRHPVLRVMAMDAYGGRNGSISYHHHPSTTPTILHCFHLHQALGELTLRDGVELEEDTLESMVECRDGGAPPLSTLAVVAEDRGPWRRTPTLAARWAGMVFWRSWGRGARYLFSLKKKIIRVEN